MPATARTPSAPTTPDAGEGAWRAAGLTAIAIAVAALSWVAFRFHPVGDYFTESDFYGAYAHGADALRHGRFDPTRYGAYGPVHEIALALVGLLVRDLFTAAQLVSLAAAAAVLALAWSVTRAAFGARAALVAVALVAVNPTFGRHAISACGDMPGTALFLGAVAAVAPGPGRARWAWGGVLAALAALTRYNLASLLPAGLIAAALAPAGTRRSAALRFAGAFVAIVGPFALAATMQGAPPGATLFRDAAFYLQDAPQTVLEQRYAGDASGIAPATLARLLTRVVAGLPSHLVSDARVLLGLPVAALAVAGLLVLAWRRRLGVLAPFAPFAALGSLALAPVYYSERYSLSLLPLDLLPAAALAGGAGIGSRGAGRIAALATVAAVAWSLRETVALETLLWRSIPVETLHAAAALRREAPPGARVLARKAHVAYAAGLEPVLFPDVPSLDSLARFCRARSVGWLYYSWYEARLRPRFSFLLDSAAVVPGLTVIDATLDKPSVTWRIDEGFGAIPPWFGDPAEARRIAARVTALMEPAAAGVR